MTTTDLTPETEITLPLEDTTITETITTENNLVTTWITDPETTTEITTTKIDITTTTEEETKMKVETEEEITKETSMVEDKTTLNNKELQTE